MIKSERKLIIFADVVIIWAYFSLFFSNESSYFDQVETDQIDNEIDKLEKNILETVCHTPEGCDSLTWPLGVPSPFKATSRHEIIRYDYFNATHIFLSGDFDVYSEMTGDILFGVKISKTVKW